MTDKRSLIALLVDDEITAQQILGRMLEDLGLTVVRAGDGASAWTCLQSNPDIALLVTDLVMPTLDGVGLVRLVRADARFRDLPIVTVSGKEGVRGIWGVMALGANYFLPKPVCRQEFSDVVSNLLGTHARPPRAVSLPDCVSA